MGEFNQLTDDELQQRLDHLKSIISQCNAERELIFREKYRRQQLKKQMDADKFWKHHAGVRLNDGDGLYSNGYEGRVVGVDIESDMVLCQFEFESNQSVSGTPPKNFVFPRDTKNYRTSVATARKWRKDYINRQAVNT